MPDLGIFLLVVAAIAIGWGMGRFSRRPGRDEGRQTLPAAYYKGLNYLINQQPDQGIEAFLDSLEVNATTLETHIALGNLMRRKGEVDRAIRIHQNLLGRSSLNAAQRHHAHFELSRDYHKAGLLDRAERLLLDLVAEAPELRAEALTLLTDIYDEEREWQQAIDTGRQLLPRRRIGQRSYSQHAVARRLAYYSCELAQVALQNGDYRLAEEKLEQAFGFDRDCVRAGMLEAERLLSQGHPRRGIKLLERVIAQSPRYVGVVLPVLNRCYEVLGETAALQQYLLGFLEQHSSTQVVLHLVEYQLQQGEVQNAARLLGQQMSRHPTLEGMARLIELCGAETAGGEQTEVLEQLRQLVLQLGEHRPRFRCENCGFSGRQLHWQCPSCKNWQTIAPVGGLEGD